MIRLEKVTKKYRSGKVMVKALDDLSLEVKKGEFVGLTGPSGSGKTTLLNIIGCLSRITSGRFWLGDEEVSHYPDHFLAALRRERFGFIFQQFNLLAGYTTWENVALPLLPMGISEKVRKGRAMRLLEELHLETRANFLANELSGGEQQMLAMARALMARPKMLLLDEPSLGLAPKMIEVVFSLIHRINQKGLTILLVEQNAWKALDLAHYAYVIESGKIHLEGTGRELLSNPQIKKSYLGE